MGRQISFSSSHSGLTPQDGEATRSLSQKPVTRRCYCFFENPGKTGKHARLLGGGGVRGSRSVIFEVDQTLVIISMDLKLSDVEIMMHLFNIAIRFLHLPLKIEWCHGGGGRRRGSNNPKVFFDYSDVTSQFLISNHDVFNAREVVGFSPSWRRVISSFSLLL